MKEQRRLAAVVSADVVGYSRLMGEDESGTLSALRTLRREVLDPGIESHGGRIVKTTGDGLLLEFPSVVDAVKCVVEAQSAMAARNADVAEDRRIELRMGVHLGDIIIDRDDIFGDGVNVAARLESIALPGGVCVSQQVIDSVGNKVDVAFVDTGAQRLKNIAQPVRAYQWAPAGRAMAARLVPAAAGMPRARLGWAVGLVLILAVGGTGYSLWPWLSSAPPESATGGPPARDALAERTSVAILPFINQSGDASQEYFSDGLTEDVIAALGRFPSLTVMSRNAVFPYKGKNARPADIGRELAVRYLVEGSVRRAGERIRVSAQLIEAASGKLLWSQQYDEDLKDVFAVQDAISRDVAGALAVNLTRAEQQRALAKPTESLDAYDLVLRGRERLWLTRRADNREARDLFARAVRADPRYAAAHAWLGRAYLQVADFGWTEDPVEAVDRAMELGRKALSLDPDTVEGLGVIAAAHAYRADYDLALTASDRLLAINPSDAGGLMGRSAVLLWLGRIDEAVETGETAFRFDPNAGSESAFILGLAYYEARRHADAVRVLEHGSQRFPDHPFIYALLAAAYARLDRMPEAARALDSLRRLNPFFDIDSFGSRFRNPAHQAYLREGIVKAGWR